MSNAIIFYVAVPVSAASATLRFLSLLLVIDPMQLNDVSFSSSCMQIRTDRIIKKCQGQNLALLSCMQATFALVFWSLECNDILLSKSPMK